MQPNFILKNEKKKIVEELNKQFGIFNLPFLLIRTGKDRIRAFSGSLSKDELKRLGREVNIENIGLYLFREEKGGIRLSFDGAHVLRKQISKNIFEIDDNQIKEWLVGRDLIVKEEKRDGFVVVKYKDDFFGCGKISQGMLRNFVPKERRIKIRF